MNLAKKITSFLKDDLKTFRAFEIVLAAISMTLPVWLRLADT
jgi:hypothetical protein